MDNFKKLIKEALTPDFLKESVNEAKYRVEFTTQDGEKAKSRVYNSEEEADKKEADLVNSGIKQAKVVKVEESVNEDRFEEDPRGEYANIPTLNKHQDILNLIRNVENYVSIDVEPDLRGYGGKGEGFYLTTPSLSLWHDSDIQKLKQAFDKTKDQSYELDFELQDTANYEMDPGERSWDAAFSFTVDEKDDGSELHPGTMGDELSIPR